METIDQSDENQVLSQTATQSAEKDAQVVTAAEAAMAITVNEQIDALPPAVVGTGRSHFVPNSDPARMVTVLTPLTENRQLLMRRVSQNSDKGCTIDAKFVADVFGDAIGKIPHKKQVTIVLIDGRQLIGYCTNTKTRNGIYLPAKYRPPYFAFPAVGALQPILVASLIVG